MRIAFLSWRDTTHPDGGGSEVFVEEVAAELVARGHEVLLRCAAHSAAPQKSWHGGVQVHRRGGRLTVYLRGLLWTLGRGRGYDVVVDVVNGLPFWTPLVRRRGVVALVHHLHERQWHLIYPGVRGRLGWWIERRLARRAYRGVPHLTVSETTRAGLVALGAPAASVHVVRNGVSTYACAVSRSPEPRLCVLARLVPHKQINHAFDVVEQLLPLVPGLVLDVVGEGWWRKQLEADVARRGLGDHVRLHGWLPDAERDAVLAAAWLMLLPSLMEGWGLAVMEAAVQGTPTVAYRDAGGVAEAVVDGETGVLVDSPADLARQVQLLLESPDEIRRLGDAAARRAAAYTWAATTDGVESVLVATCRDQRRQSE